LDKIEIEFCGRLPSGHVFFCQKKGGQILSGFSIDLDLMIEDKIQGKPTSVLRRKAVRI
jgi:hypothetical protein